MTSRFLPLKVAITLYQLPRPPLFQSSSVTCVGQCRCEQIVHSNLSDYLKQKMILLESQNNDIKVLFIHKVMY